MTSVGDRAEEWRRLGMGSLLVLLYLFLYAPIAYVVYASFSQDIVWPFPPSFTLTAYEDLFDNSIYGDGLLNSLTIGIGSGVLSTLIATAAVIGVLRFPSRHRTLAFLIFLSPLFVAE